MKRLPERHLAERVADAVLVVLAEVSGLSRRPSISARVMPHSGGRHGSERRGIARPTRSEHDGLVPDERATDVGPRTAAYEGSARDLPAAPPSGLAPLPDLAHHDIWRFLPVGSSRCSARVSAPLVAGRVGSEHPMSVARVVDIVPADRSDDADRDWQPSIAVNPGNANEIVIVGYRLQTAPQVTWPIYYSYDRGQTWQMNFSVTGDQMDQSAGLGTSGELYWAIAALVHIAPTGLKITTLV